jgi:hypothetical protein
MAAPTVALDYPKPARLGNTPMGVVSGLVTISSYDTAHPAVTAITGVFKPSGLLRVVPNGESSNGYTVRWDHATDSFKAYLPAGTVANPTISAGSGSAGVALGVTSGALTISGGATGVTGVIAGGFTGSGATEAGAAANVGTVEFIAVGQLG